MQRVMICLCWMGGDGRPRVQYKAETVLKCSALTAGQPKETGHKPVLMSHGHGKRHHSGAMAIMGSRIFSISLIPLSHGNPGIMHLSHRTRIPGY